MPTFFAAAALFVTAVVVAGTTAPVVAVVARLRHDEGRWPAVSRKLEKILSIYLRRVER